MNNQPTVIGVLKLERETKGDEFIFYRRIGNGMREHFGTIPAYQSVDFSRPGTIGARTEMSGIDEVVQKAAGHTLASPVMINKIEFIVVGEGPKRTFTYLKTVGEETPSAQV